MTSEPNYVEQAASAWAAKDPTAAMGRRGR